MEQSVIWTLRISLGIVFLFTGYYILTSKDHWTSMIKPWIEPFIPGSKKTAMLLTGYYDLFQGIWLLSGIYLWLAAIFATLHMIQVLIATGINDVTYRDIGILGMSIALFLLTNPF